MSSKTPKRPRRAVQLKRWVKTQALWKTPELPYLREYPEEDYLRTTILIADMTNSSGGRSFMYRRRRPLGVPEDPEAREGDSSKIPSCLFSLGCCQFELTSVFQVIVREDEHHPLPGDLTQSSLTRWLPVRTSTGETHMHYAIYSPKALRRIVASTSGTSASSKAQGETLEESATTDSKSAESPPNSSLKRKASSSADTSISASTSKKSKPTPSSSTTATTAAFPVAPSTSSNKPAKIKKQRAKRTAQKPAKVADKGL